MQALEDVGVLCMEDHRMGDENILQVVVVGADGDNLQVVAAVASLRDVAWGMWSMVSLVLLLWRAQRAALKRLNGPH